MEPIEKIRQSFKPPKVNLLFIAESPPKGGTFFYERNSNLYNAVKEAFGLVFKEFENSQFLFFFKELGCYLDDLCLKPINGLSDKDRKAERLKGINPLAKRINLMQPRAVIILMKGIETEVKKAIVKSNIETIELIQVTSFPAFTETNRLNCINGVSLALTILLNKKIIRNTT